MRHVPELHFHYDDSVDKGERIDNLLRDEPARRRRRVVRRRLVRVLTPTVGAAQAAIGPDRARAQTRPHDLPPARRHPAARQAAGPQLQPGPAARRGTCSAPRRAATPAAWIRSRPACCRCASAKRPRSPVTCWATRKAYETAARLGVTTDTDDADGAGAARAARARRSTRAQVEAALRALHRAHPPASADLFRAQAGRRAAVRQGAPRRGHRGRPSARSTSTSIASAATWTRDRAAPRRSTCGSGTYIRSLVRDLGEALGCGAHVAGLRRLWVDPFREPRHVHPRRAAGAGRAG